MPVAVRPAGSVSTTLVGPPVAAPPTLVAINLIMLSLLPGARLVGLDTELIVHAGVTVSARAGSAIWAGSANAVATASRPTHLRGIFMVMPSPSRRPKSRRRSPLQS